MNADVFKLRSSNVGLGTVDLENPVDALLPARVPHVGEKATTFHERKSHGSARLTLRRSKYRWVDNSRILSSS
jgi:hypothetical protein